MTNDEVQSTQIGVVGIPSICTWPIVIGIFPILPDDGGGATATGVDMLVVWGRRVVIGGQGNWAGPV